MVKLILSKAYFRAKYIIGDKGHSTIIKVWVHKEVLNFYEQKTPASEYTKRNQILLRRKINKSTFVETYFNTSIEITARTRQPKTAKDIEDLNNAIN